MTPYEFQAKWEGHQLKERSACQEHFLDLCALVGHPTPAASDATGSQFCFEKAVTTVSGGRGFADVWKNEFFGWEYKGPSGDLDAAYQQLLTYREALGNPPLLVVSDTQVIQIHTNFTGTAKRIHSIGFGELAAEETRAILHDLFFEPDRLKPVVQSEYVTAEAARNFGAISEGMRRRKIPAHDAAHFLMRLIFCLFAQDTDLLPKGLVTKAMESFRHDRQEFAAILAELFRAMATGSRFAYLPIAHFNGGLFDGATSYELDPPEITQLIVAAKRDWSQIEPSIFGTLFERALDPAKRSQLGAHYTSKADILDVVEPVLMAPLRADWQALRERGEEKVASVATLPRGARRDKALAPLEADLEAFCAKLGATRVLDPACGSGNFLYVALRCLLELEHDVRRACARWKCRVPEHRVGPEQVYGLELDEYAAELAQLTVWIGYLQFRYSFNRGDLHSPILRELDTIRQLDAILAPDGSEPEWPAVDVIIGNPPFLGDKKMRSEMGDAYVERARALWAGRVPSGADLCCYWFEKARAQIEAGQAKRAGLLATNSIRQGKNRVVLDRIAASGGIFMAWADREWVLAGAAVRISMVGFNGVEQNVVLDGRSVDHINPDLTTGADVTQAVRLAANRGLALIGSTKKGPFDIPGALAREMLTATNPLGRDNADVIQPFWNGLDILRRPRDMWLIDFGERSADESALYEAPFEYVKKHVLPLRLDHREARQAKKWWQLARPVTAVLAAVSDLGRVLGTVNLAKYRLFVWLPCGVNPDHQLTVFPRDDDYFFGILHSRLHEKWSLRIASSLEDRPRYTPTTCFETFPFPAATPDRRAAVADAARALDEARQSALDANARLTLTALYNKRPTWLANLHAALDASVLSAYGWPADLGDEELLARLLALNLERAAREAHGEVVPP